jgi:hypothetical protein
MVSTSIPVKLAGKRSHTSFLQEKENHLATFSSSQKRQRVAPSSAYSLPPRDLFTPPPSSELDIPGLNDSQEDVVRRVQFRPHVLSSSPGRSSSPLLPTTPVRPERLDLPGLGNMLNVAFDGTCNLVLGRSRQSRDARPSTSSSQLITVSDEEVPECVRNSDISSRLLPTNLLPLPRHAQHSSRQHVVLTLSMHGELLLHVLGQNGCRVRILGSRRRAYSSSPIRSDDGQVGKRYNAGRTITIRPPSEEDAVDALIVDIEIDMYSCKVIVTWTPPVFGRGTTPAAPLAQSYSLKRTGLSGLLSPPSSPVRREITPVGMHDYPELNDLPPSSPPMGVLDDLEEDEQEVRMEEEEGPMRETPQPIPTPVQEIDRPKDLPEIRRRDYASFEPVRRNLKPLEADIFGLVGLAGQGRRNVVQKKISKIVTTPVRSREITPVVSGAVTPVTFRENTPVVQVKEKEKVVTERPVEKVVERAVERVKERPLPVPEEPRVESRREIDESPLSEQPLVPSPIEVEALTPLERLVEPETLIQDSFSVVPEPGLTLPASELEVQHPSSPTRSIYSQMTSDSEDDRSDPLDPESMIVEKLKRKNKAGRVNRVKKESLEGSAGAGRAVSPIKPEMKPVEEKRAEKIKPVLVPGPASLEENDGVIAPPDHLDLQALVATSIVFSGVSAISALDLVKAILDVSPPGFE